MATSHGEDTPLLRAADTPDGASIRSSSSLLKPSAADDEIEDGPSTPPEFGNIEDSVLPEESVLGRNIDWKSAYIIAISRVIGSGIFAVPGVILTSVGSIGLSLSVWILGAVVVACGLAVSLEYGYVSERCLEILPTYSFKEKKLPKKRNNLFLLTHCEGACYPVAEAIKCTSSSPTRGRGSSPRP